MNKEFKVLSGTMINRLGGGYASFVVSSDDNELERSRHGILLGAIVKTISVDFTTETVVGSDGSISGYVYEYRSSITHTNVTT